MCSYGEIKIRFGRMLGACKVPERREAKLIVDGGSFISKLGSQKKYKQEKKKTGTAVLNT